MKICNNCGKEVNDNDVFCPHCGAELQGKKKISFFERLSGRSQEREREKQYLMSKAVLQSKDVENVEEWNLEDITVSEKADANKSKRLSIFKIIAEIVVTFFMVVIMKILGDFDINKNIKLIAIFILFIRCTVYVALFISELNYVIVLSRMMKTNLAIKKIKYGDPPTLYTNRKLYEINSVDKCKKCDSTTHIEEFEGKLYVVCDSDREHIYLIDSKQLLKKTGFANLNEDSESKINDKENKDEVSSS